jgi:hypothetical protein
MKLSEAIITIFAVIGFLWILISVLAVMANTPDSRENIGLLVFLLVTMLVLRRIIVIKEKQRSPR